MRLFIAVNFDDTIKKKISQIADWLKQQGIKGNYAKESNYHITLLFLGQSEQSQIPFIKDAIVDINESHFDITLNNISSFGKNIIYLGVNDSKHLKNINAFLFNRLRNTFDLQPNRFSPHITLIRNPDYVPSGIKVDEILPYTYTVNDISLMQSLRVEGELVYRSIFVHKLK
ncbi:MAG TPA: RNA 2',3'-cyclic phosphodiesterase [Clostridia bacterium]